jgi:NodT family efflux transporter outer membrane factor (OMF) lipoprotein
MKSARVTTGAGRAAGICAVALTALVSACQVGPNYHAPTLPAGAAAPLVSLASGQESADPAPDAWWHLYDDSRLDALVREALQANRSLAAADANLAAARAVVSAMHANRYPSTSLSAGGIYGRDAITDEILELGGHAPVNTWIYDDLIESAYEIDLFGRVHRAIEAANARSDAVAAARDSVRVVVAADTARAYAAICALGEQIEVAQRSLDVVSQQARISERRHEAGANSVFDVTRAQALASQVGAAVPVLEGQRRVALFELTALLGRTPQAAPHELEDCKTPPQLSDPIPVGDGAMLIRRRPDLRQAERQLAVATAQIGVATADLYPSIRLVGLYGGIAAQTSQLNTSVGRTWGIGPSVSWSFPNMAGPRARVRQAKAAQAAALASFDGVVLTALKEVEQSLSLYGAALANRQALVEARDRIHTAFGIAAAEFGAGSVSSLDLLTTEQSLVSLDAAVAAADGAVIQNQIAVFKALGGGWQGTNGTGETLAH